MSTYNLISFIIKCSSSKTLWVEVIFSNSRLGTPTTDLTSICTVVNEKVLLLKKQIFSINKRGGGSTWPSLFFWALSLFIIIKLFKRFVIIVLPHDTDVYIAEITCLFSLIWKYLSVTLSYDHDYQLGPIVILFCLCAYACVLVLFTKWFA